VSLFDRSAQKDILKAIQRNASIGGILRDVIDEHTPRAMEMQHLYNRFKKLPCTNWQENRLPLEFDGVPIYGRQLPNTKLYKVNMRLHHPFDARMVQTFTGYMSNDVSVSIDEQRVGERAAQEANLFLQDLDHINNGESLRARLTEHAVRSGTGGLMLYWNGSDIRMMPLQPWSFAVIYDPMTGVPQYAARWWREKTDDPNNPDQIVAEWYDRNRVSWYETDRDGKFQPASRGVDGQTGAAVSEMLHLFGAPAIVPGHVPIIEFPKNPERVGDVELSLSLQDAYDVAISDLASELSQFRSAYISMKDNGLKVDKEFIETVRQTGIFALSKEGEVGFIERSLNAEGHFKHTEQLKENIFLMSNSVDFSQISGETRIMGLEMRMKPLDESARTTAQMFTTSLRRTYAAVTDFAREYLNTDIDARALDWVFTFNRPTITSEEITNFVATDGLMADIDRFKLLTFVDDPRGWLERWEAQKAQDAQRFLPEEEPAVTQ
jgi:SPP1 family phage portal protein